jgi:hypothetical protein
MALSDLALSLMAFPQDWDGTGLDLNVLLVPAADPTANLSLSGPPFSGTTYTLQAIFIPGLGSPPADGDPASKVFPFSTPAPASAGTLFNALKAKLAPTANAPTSTPGVSIRKALPPSYTSSFAFEQPRDPDFFSLGEDFGCSMRGKDPQPLQPPPPATVSWGQVISYALHQPALAAALPGVGSLRRRPGRQGGPHPDVCRPHSAADREPVPIRPGAVPGERRLDEHGSLRPGQHRSAGV